MIPTGGLIHHSGLNDVVKNIGGVKDAMLLELMLLVHDMTIAKGLAQYCVMARDKLDRLGHSRASIPFQWHTYS